MRFTSLLTYRDSLQEYLSIMLRLLSPTLQNHRSRILAQPTSGPSHPGLTRQKGTHEVCAAYEILSLHQPLHKSCVTVGGWAPAPLDTLQCGSRTGKSQMPGIHLFHSKPGLPISCRTFCSFGILSIRSLFLPSIEPRTSSQITYTLHHTKLLSHKHHTGKQPQQS